MQLFDFYKNVLHFNEDALITVTIKATEQRTLHKGKYVIRVNQVPTHMYFLINGVIRGFILDCHGKDITDGIIYRRGNPAMPDNDFFQPASITLEALTDSEIICIPFSAVIHLLEKYPSLAELYQRLLLFSANMHRRLKIAIYQYTATQRYEWLLKEYLGLINQINQNTPPLYST